jgi:hypothetical protein
MLSQSMPFLAGASFSLSPPPSSLFTFGAVGATTSGASSATGTVACGE